MGVEISFFFTFMTLSGFKFCPFRNKKPKSEEKHRFGVSKVGGTLYSNVSRFPNHVFDVVMLLAVKGPGQGPAVLKPDWGPPYVNPAEARRGPFCNLSRARLEELYLVELSETD